MDLTMRLQILKDAGQLSEKNYQVIVKVIQMFGDDWNIGLSEENGAMFVTHLAVALERIERGEPVKPLDESIAAELKAQACYADCNQALLRIETIFGRTISEAEKGYLLVHLCTLYAKEVQG